MTTTILPRTTPLVVFSRHHHRAVEIDARSGIFACQTTRSSVTGTRTWKKTPSLLLMLLFGIALRRSFFLSSVSRNFSFVFFSSDRQFLENSSLSFSFSRPSNVKVFGPVLFFFVCVFPSSAATSRAIFFPSSGPQICEIFCEQNNLVIIFVCSVVK